MKKRFLAITLTLALCMGLAVPAFATEPPETYTEAFKNVSVSSTLGREDDEATYDSFVKTELELMEFEFDDEGSEVEVPKTLSGYNAIVADSETTVAYSGTPEEDNSYIQVYVTAYINQGDGVYVWEEFPHSKYLTNDGTFLPNYVSPEEHGGLVELKAGEKVTFKLPDCYDESEEKVDPDDVLYILRLEKWYPDTETEITDEFGYTYPVMRYFYEELAYKVDEDAVEKAIANGPIDETAAPTFTDVSADEYYAAPVAWAVENKITNGATETTFEPDSTCTQVQILTFLYRAAGEPETEAELPVDIEGKDLDYAEGALRWAAEKGMIDESFDVDAECTRASAVSYIWQAFDKPEAEASSFVDVEADADYAAAVNWAVEIGVTNGTDEDAGLFSPGDTCTRGQIVTFLHRAYVEEARLTAEE